MESRRLGRTNLKVSVLGFGCGFVGGLMVRGSDEEREKVVGRALDLGVNYFDTAPLYGGGQSEENLGRALAGRHQQITVGTKVMLARADRDNIQAVIAKSVETSLKRMQLDHLDLLQLHNTVCREDGEHNISAKLIIDEVAIAFDRLRQQGKIRFCGFSGHGDTSEMHTVIESGVMDTLQVVYNLLNPSAAKAIPPDYPAQDYKQLFEKMRDKDMGAIGIRALAGGALSGVEVRHPVGGAAVDPLGSGSTYQADVMRAREFKPLQTEGYGDSLIDLALRFAIARPELATTVIGFSSLDQLEYAAACAQKGPLPPAALKRAAELRHRFVGEQR